MKLTVRQVGARVRYWQGVLHLRHWEFDVLLVDGFDDNPEAYARCHCEESYDQASLSFKHAWLEGADEDEFERTVVHELLHVYMRNFDHAVERVEDQLSKAVADLWHEQVKHERENMVDRLARLLIALHG